MKKMCVLIKKIEKKMRFLYATKDCVSSSHLHGESYMFNFDNKMKYNIINLKCLSLMPLDSNKNNQIMITDIKSDILVPYEFNFLNISKNE